MTMVMMMMIMTVVMAMAMAMMVIMPVIMAMAVPMAVPMMMMACVRLRHIPIANMPNRLTSKPSVLTTKSCVMLFITGGSMIRCTASNKIKTLMSTRKMPFAKPDSVSTRL